MNTDLRAYRAFADAIETLGGPGTDGGAIAGIFVASKIATFDGHAYVARADYWSSPSIQRAQSFVNEIDARAASVPCVAE